MGLFFYLFFVVGFSRFRWGLVVFGGVCGLWMFFFFKSLQVLECLGLFGVFARMV